MKTITNLAEKDKEKLRKPILKELEKLQKKYGIEEVRYTFNWWNVRELGKRKRKKEIEKLKKEIKVLQKGKIPY